MHFQILNWYVNLFDGVFRKRSKFNSAQSILTVFINDITCLNLINKKNTFA